MSKLTSLILRRKEIEEQKPTLRQQFKDKLHLRKKETKSTWSTLWSRKQQVNSKQKENQIEPIFTVNIPITVYNTTVNNYYSNDKNNNQLDTSTTSIIKQLVVLSPFQIYGFLFVCSLLLIVIGFGILQVHRIITILQILLDDVHYFLIGILSNSLRAFSFLKSLISYHINYCCK